MQTLVHSPMIGSAFMEQQQHWVFICFGFVFVFIVNSLDLNPKSGKWANKILICNTNSTEYFYVLMSTV